MMGKYKKRQQVDVGDIVAKDNIFYIGKKLAVRYGYDITISLFPLGESGICWFSPVGDSGSARVGEAVVYGDVGAFSKPIEQFADDGYEVFAGAVYRKPSIIDAVQVSKDNLPAIIDLVEQCQAITGACINKTSVGELEVEIVTDDSRFTLFPEQWVVIEGGKVSVFDSAVFSSEYIKAED